jgi:type I restriction enzyme M protein
MDALQPLGSITGSIMEGLPNRPGFYPGGLTMILTNPPFGGKVTNVEVLRDFAARDGLTKKDGEIVSSIPQEVAFINRCLEFLVPGGKLGIVLPDGLLANTSTQDIRSWILRRAKLKAIISLPQEIFYPISVKTSIIFLEKRRDFLKVEEIDDEYSVYFAQVQGKGRSGSYKPNIFEDEIIAASEIDAVNYDFRRKLGWLA